jgi:hypothetical protein
MTEGALSQIASSQEALIGALDANDLAALEAAVASLESAVGELRRPGQHLLGEALSQALARNQAARVRVNFLTDSNRRRLHAMAALRGGPSGLTYSR